MHLNEAELFIAFVLEDLAEQTHIVIFVSVLHDAVHYRDGPFDYQVF